MYRALYRKWRPKTFDEVCGQEHITTVLKNQVLSSTVSHAYLFCGIHGTGKTTCAKVLAKAVNCESPIDGSPCGKCNACVSIDNGTATDVLEIDAASNNGVDSIRAIRDEVVYPPSVLKKRVYIIDEVHMLTDSADNALLKTLEEPPEYVLFILATTELQKIPSTILSRCQRFEFRRIEANTIAERVKFICFHEQIDIDDDSVNLIARLSDGAMRDALSLLESCTASLGGGVIKYEATERQLGVANNDEVVSILKFAACNDVSAAMEVLNRLYRESRDLATLVNQLTFLTRDLLVIQSLPGIGLNNLGSSFCFGKTMFESLVALANDITKEQLLYYFDVLSEAQSRLSYTTQDKKLVAELAVIKLSTPMLVENTASLRARVSALEAGVTLNIAKADCEQIATKNKEGQKSVPPSDANVGSDSGQERKPFLKKAEMLELLSQRGAGLVYAFASTADFFVDGDTLLIKPDNDIAADKLSDESAVKLLTECVVQAARRAMKVIVIKEKQAEAQSTLFIDELL